LQHLSTFDSILNWVELPMMGLLLGILGGNFVTRGFGFLIGLPTILWLEQNPSDLNREGFPTGANSDSPWVLDREAGTHGQAFVGGFADQGSPSG